VTNQERKQITPEITPSGKCSPVPMGDRRDFPYATPGPSRRSYRLRVWDGVHLSTFAAGFLLGSMFGACLGALTIGALRAAKRDDVNSLSLDKLEDEITQNPYPSYVHDHRKA